MKLSNVRIKIAKYDTERVKAIVSLILDDCLVINDIKIVKKKDSSELDFYFHGSKKNYIYFCNKSKREEFREEILNCYYEYMDEIQNLDNT